MSRFAAQTLELAIAHFPDALVPAGGAEALRRAAPHLAPGRQLYFECRLGGDDRSIDVSQHFFAYDDGAAALLDLAGRRAAAGGPAEAAWRRIADFAREWGADPALEAVAEIGLEHDLGGDGEWIAAPAVFAAFRSGVLADRHGGARFVDAVVPEGRAAWERLVATLEAAERCGLTGGRMIGAMLSRDAQLRTMVRGLSCEPLREFLAAVGWQGDAERLLALLAEPVLGGEATRLVLGFAPGLVADCGLEAIHGYDDAGIAARDALLDRLVDAELAERGRVDALSEWPGAITPVGARADWPDAMLVRDLLAPAERAHFAGFVNHVKLNLPHGRPPQPAKAYLSLAPVPTKTHDHA